MPDRIGVLQDDLHLLAWLRSDDPGFEPEDLTLAREFSASFYVDATEQ